MDEEIVHVPRHLVEQAVFVPWPAALVLPFGLQEVRDGRFVAVVLRLERGELGRRFGDGPKVLERAASEDASCHEPHQRFMHLDQLIPLIEICRTRDRPARHNGQQNSRQQDPGREQRRGLFDGHERQRPQHEQARERDANQAAVPQDDRQKTLLMCACPESCLRQRATAKRRQPHVPHRAQARRRDEHRRNRVHRDRRGGDIAVHAAVDLRVDPRRPFDEHRIVRLGRAKVGLQAQP